jgi:hypothetical protein
MRSVTKAAVDGDEGRLAEELDAVFAGTDSAASARDRNGTFYSACLATLFMMDCRVSSTGVPGGDPYIVLEPYDRRGLVIAIGVRYDSGTDKESSRAIAENDAIAGTQAETALRAIYASNCLEPYRAKAEQLVPVGLGIAGRGRCRAIIGDQSETTVIGYPSEATVARPPFPLRRSKAPGKTTARATVKPPAQVGKAALKPTGKPAAKAGKARVPRRSPPSFLPPAVPAAGAPAPAREGRALLLQPLGPR